MSSDVQTKRQFKSSLKDTRQFHYNPIIRLLRFINYKYTITIYTLSRLNLSAANAPIFKLKMNLIHSCSQVSLILLKVSILLAFFLSPTTTATKCIEIEMETCASFPGVSNAIH